jgi:hypothetical protein
MDCAGCWQGWIAMSGKYNVLHGSTALLSSGSDRSLEEWKMYDETTVNALIAHLRKIEGQVSQKTLASKAAATEPRMSRWLNRKTQWNAIDCIAYGKIVDFLDAERLLPGIRDRRRTEYAGLAEFYGQTSENVDAIRKNSCGHYAVYRWSNAKRRSILRGWLFIDLDPDSGIVTTREEYRARFAHNERHWPRTGYFVGRGTRGYVVASRKTDSNEVQLMYLRNPTPRRTGGPDDKETAEFVGIICDMQDSEIYYTPVIIEKIKEKLCERDICDLLSESKDQVRMADALSKLISFEGNIALFNS